MPRDRTDVARRSLFGAGTPPSGNQEGETGERRPKARPNRDTAPRVPNDRKVACLFAQRQRPRRRHRVGGPWNERL